MNTAETSSNKKHSTLFLGFFLMVTLCAGIFFVMRTEDKVISSSLTVLPSIKKKPPAQEISMTFVGDIMVHDEQRQAGFDAKTKTYHFDSFFKHIEESFRNKDIVFGNLETPIAGASLRYGGYPMFNAPETLLESLSGAHFSHLSLANNHALDRRAGGLKNTILAVKKHGFVGIGAQDTPEEDRFVITEKNGITVGFLGYTYGTNGLSLPKDASYMLNYIDDKTMKEDLTRLKEKKPDLVVVSLHFGDEYKRTQNASQIAIANSLCEAGADIVIGSHPHVLEPALFLDKKDGTKCFVIYSLGNFVSAMTVLYTDLGGILTLNVKKEKDHIYLTPNFTPTWVRQGKDASGTQMFEVRKLSDDTLSLTVVQQKRIALYKKFVDNDIVQFEQGTSVLLK